MLGSCHKLTLFSFYRMFGHKCFMKSGQDGWLFFRSPHAAAAMTHSIADALHACIPVRLEAEHNLKNDA